jgi:type I restriction-modification system DNA methylase subunit
VKVRWLGLEQEVRERVKYESYAGYRASVGARLLREVNTQVASAEGEKGGEFYTPTCLMRLLVEMPAPCKNRIYDPYCGSGGMFVQSEKLIQLHRGKPSDISIDAQKSNYTAWRLVKMNLAICGIDAQIAHGATFHNERHPDLKPDYVLANPPFNDSDRRGEFLKDDKRRVYGTPPARLADFVLANGSMSSNRSGKGEATDNIVGEPEHSTLSNPPYDKSWKSDLEWRGSKDGIKDPRFVIEYVSDPEHSLLTRSSEGQMLFLANMRAKMKHGTPPGRCIAEVRNGASVFTSDAGHFTTTTVGTAR